MTNNTDKNILEFEKAIGNFFRNFRLNNPTGQTSKIVVFLFLLFAAIGSFYSVQPDEEAVVLRLGRYIGTKGPGLQFKIPFGIDKTFKLQTQQVLQEEFGFRTDKTRPNQSSVYSKTANGAQAESLMLTGDLNIAEVEWVVQYQISDPYKYLFSTSTPRKNIRDVSEAIVRRVVGDRLVNAVFERTGMATESKALIQEILDHYDMGVRIIAIEFQDVLPPMSVRPSFNEVNAARQELEKLINEAEARYNKVIPEARGKAEKSVAEAEGLALATINRAKGEGEKFKSMLTEYRKSPKITKDRLYLETMEKIFARLENIKVVDSEVKGLLPVFANPVK